MTWRVALAWVDTLFLDRALLGIWRAQYGPGPWSIFFLRPDGVVIEAWAVSGGTLYGKKLTTGGESNGTDMAG